MPDTTTTTQQPPSSSSSSGGGGDLFTAAASVVNNFVNNLFGQKRKNEAQQFQEQLASLSASQQYQLAVALQQAQTDTERMQILDNAVASIQQQAVQQAGSGSFQLGVLILLGAMGLFAMAYIIKRNSQ